MLSLASSVLEPPLIDVVDLIETTLRGCRTASSACSTVRIHTSGDSCDVWAFLLPLAMSDHPWQITYVYEPETSTAAYRSAASFL